MTKMNTLGVLLASSFLVSACSSSDFAAEDSVARGIEIANGIFDETITPMAAEDLPEGQAELSGLVAVVSESELAAVVEVEVIVGDLALTANFDTTDIEGEVTNVGIYAVEVDDVELDLVSMELLESLEGTLDVGGSIIGSSIDGFVGGLLTGADYTADVEGGIEGAFYDDGGSLIAAGFVEGGVLITPDEGEPIEELLFGVFYAED